MCIIFFVNKYDKPYMLTKELSRLIGYIFKFRTNTVCFKVFYKNNK